MECRAADLRMKEVIDVRDGTRYGYISDVEVDTATGRISALVVYGRMRWFGLLGREEDRVFPWSAVRRFGEDLVLVEGSGGRAPDCAAEPRAGNFTRSSR